MATWEDPDELISCPYDPVHLVQRKRIQYHLMKCRKNFNVKDFRQCPFNARHVVPKPEFDYHIKTCDDRGRFEVEQLKAQAQRDPNLKGNTSIPTFDPSWRPESTESWDDDNVVYVPPTSGDMLFSSDQSREPIAQSPSPPPPNRQRQSAVEIREPMLPRPPRSAGQPSSQVFNQAMQGGAGVGSMSARVVPTGRGRGRGRGRGIVVQETKPAVGKIEKNEAVEVPENFEDGKKELLRRQRKLQKMLRQIERLESKTTPLLEEEVAKVGKKQQVLEQIKQTGILED